MSSFFSSTLTRSPRPPVGRPTPRSATRSRTRTGDQEDDEIQDGDEDPHGDQDDDATSTRGRGAFARVARGMCMRALKNAANARTKDTSPGGGCRPWEPPHKAVVR